MRESVRPLEAERAAAATVCAWAAPDREWSAAEDRSNDTSSAPVRVDVEDESDVVGAW